MNRDLKHYIKCFIHYLSSIQHTEIHYSQISVKFFDIFEVAIKARKQNLVKDFIGTIIERFRKNKYKLFKILIGILSHAAPEKSFSHIVQKSSQEHKAKAGNLELLQNFMVECNIFIVILESINLYEDGGNENF